MTMNLAMQHVLKPDTVPLKPGLDLKLWLTYTVEGTMLSVCAGGARINVNSVHWNV